MDVSFGPIDPVERPILILKNAGGTPLGILGYAKNVNVQLKYNEVSTLSFELPAYVDGEKVPFYDDVIGMRIVELQSVGQFVLMNPSESGDGVSTVKTCSAYSIEYEFTYKKISIPNDTYRFWSEADPSNSVLGMIMELMPSWRVGSVAVSLEGRYRTFEVNNENVYNFMKGTLQKTYNCIFDFNTFTRTVYVRDVNDDPDEERVYLSHDNLIKQIELREETEDVVTRLDVSGADGVSIRDVNPNGTNKIINLDYFMTTDNFSQDLIDKYYQWKKINEENRESYYARSIQYSIAVMQSVTEQAKLFDLQGEMTTLENILAVTIQAIARGLQTQEDMDAVNADIDAKQAEIDDQNELIASIRKTIDEIMGELKAITEKCNFNNFFTNDEIIQLDRYIKDGEIVDSTFVPSTTESYTDNGTGAKYDSLTVDITGASFEKFDSLIEDTIYDIRNGKLKIGDVVTGDIITACVDIRKTGEVVISFRMSNLDFDGATYPSGCISITGKLGSSSDTEDSLSINVVDGYQYFTMDASEYEMRSIAWELYEYGESVLNKISRPAYTFSVSSANFLALEDFVAFKNALRLGERVYIDIAEGKIIKPICTGVTYQYENPETFELEFGDKFVSGDASFQLVDLLEQSITMGKELEMSQYLYAQFCDSGAMTGIKQFMTSALDASKNAIMTSTEQAVTWDGAGLRLRKWLDRAHTVYEDEQIWMNNNSIVMTADHWRSAQMAIGKFYDENLGDCWGVVAPMLVGTVLAGSTLVIESEKKDGGTAVFKVDSDGCRLYNSDFYIVGANTSIALNPDIGIAIGDTPLYTLDKDGTKVLVEDNAKFWADQDGNLHLRGRITATELIIASGDTLTDIDNFVKNYTERIHDGTDGIYFTSSDVAACIINTKDGIKVVGTDGTYFQLKNTAMGFFGYDGNPMLYYENGEMTLSGNIYAKGGKIGGFTIGNPGGGISEALFCGGERGTATSTGMSANPDWAFWAGDGQFRVTQYGHVYANSGVFRGTIYAEDGEFNGTVYATDGEFTGTIHATDGEFTGKIVAKSGSLGGFTIGSPGGGIAEALYCGGERGTDMSTGISANYDWAFWAGDGKFRVTQGGKVYAEDGTFKGVIEASGGKIGGFTIGSPGGIIEEALYCGGTFGTSTSTGMSAHPEWAFWAGGGTFRVTQSGEVHADNGVFKGTVYASDGEFTGTVHANDGEFNGTIHAKDGSFEGTIIAKDGSIGGFTIGSPGGGIPEALYCGGQRGSSTSTGISATNSEWAFWAGDGKFRVTQDGKLYADVGVFGGDVYAKNIVVGGDAGYITGGQIGDGEVSSGNIHDGSVTPVKLDRVYATDGDLLIQAGRIDMYADEIAAHAKTISLHTEKLDSHGERLSSAEVDIDSLQADILLKATKKELDDSIKEAYVDIDAAKANITAHAEALDKYGERISSAEVSIDGLKGEIDLKAEKTVTDDLGSRLNTAEVNISAATASIELKADSKDLDKLSGEFNSASLRIDGLEGAISAEVTRMDEFGGWVSGQITAHADAINIATQEANSAGDILRKAGLSVSPSGVLQYAEDNERNLMSYIKTQADSIVLSSQTIIARAQQIDAQAESLQWLAGQNEATQGRIDDVESKITMESNRISLVVEGTGANAKIKPASIVAAINEQDKSSSVKISADYIVLNGYVQTSQLNAATARIDNLISGTTVASYLHASTIQAASSFICLGYSATWRTIEIPGVGQVIVLSHH